VVAESSSPATAWLIVLTWNGREVVEACLDSLRPALARGHRVVVVDNGSRDGTAELVRREFPAIERIENSANLGFAAGNNVGIRYALARGAENVVLVNQDAILAPDCVDELVAAARRHPEAGTVSAKVLYLKEPRTLWFAGATFSTHTGRSRHVGQGELDAGQHDREREIDRGCACAMLLTRRMFEKVGLFDEELFLFGEEIDLALRARRLGFTDQFAPRARAWHHVSYSTKDWGSWPRTFYLSRNLLFLVHREALALPAWRRWTRVFATLSGRVAEALVSSSPFSQCVAVAKGARDFAFGRRGEFRDGSMPPRHG
jgi:GT2 family glycosyltransferase